MLFNSIDNVLPAFFVWCMAYPLNKTDILVVDNLWANSGFFGGTRLRLLRTKGLPKIFLRGLRSTRSVGILSYCRLCHHRFDSWNAKAVIRFCGVPLF